MNPEDTDMPTWMRFALALSGLGVWTLLGCASTPPPLASSPIRWAAVADERVPEIVTRDPDGSERTTKLWLVVHEGQGYIRTGNSRWFRNIEREPKVVLRVDGAGYRLQASRVVDDELRRRVNGAFREKYGWQDFLIHPRGAPGANILRLTPRAPR